MPTEFQMAPTPVPASASPRPPLPFVPVHDRGGWYPVDADQSTERLQEYFAAHPPALKHHEKRELPADPEWDGLGARGEVAKLLYGAGFKSKACRYGACYRTAIPYDCSNLSCLTKVFARYHCGCRFCKYCGPMLFKELMERYAGPVSRRVSECPSHQGMTLARLNFTMKATGEVPTRDEIRSFNRAVRAGLKVAIPKSAAGKMRYGILWADEFGFEKCGRRRDRRAKGLNLHAHAFYYGPNLAWYKLRDAWTEALRAEGLDGQGCWVTFLKGWQRNSARAVRRALGHMLKYVSKIPAETPERIAALEIAFDGVRRVHSGGLFYALERIPDEFGLPKASLACPRCEQPMHRAGCQPWERFSVECLEREGRRDIAELRRERVFSAGLVYGRASP